MTRLGRLWIHKWPQLVWPVQGEALFDSAVMATAGHSQSWDSGQHGTKQCGAGQWLCTS
jgi:hypothetical protein